MPLGANITRDGVSTVLTAREVEILRWLATHAGQVVSRAELLQNVWRVGKRVTRPLTGNSLHLVLDPSGRAVDALPGLVAPEVFAAQLAQAHRFALADRTQLAAAHGKALAKPVAPPPPDRATAASMIAMTKHLVEAPILRAVAPPSLAHDTRTNLALHARIHDAFARGRGVQATIEELVGWIYRDLFLMPPDDPALGLDVADPL